jgi:ATP adenylyltransferase
MKLLYSPWREAYVEDIHQKYNNSGLKGYCVFCSHFATTDDDKKNFILSRFTHHAIMLNLYPYNAGHLLIVSFDHVPSLTLLSSEARAELIELTHTSIIILESVLKPAGLNIGINQGKAGGAGIPEHFHQHILPRWIGDTNFLPTLTNTKQISIDLHKLYDKLHPHFAKM